MMSNLLMLMTLFSSFKENNNVYKYFINRYNYNHKNSIMLIIDSCISIEREFIDEDIKYQNRIFNIYLTANAICNNKNVNVIFMLSH